MRKGDIAIAVASACLAMVLSGCAQGAGVDGSGLSDGVDALDRSSQEQANEEGIVLDIAGMDLDYSDRDLDAGYDEAAAVYVILDGDTASVGAADDGTAAAKAETEGADEAEGSEAGVAAVTVEGSTVVIAAEGTYVISGSLDNGQLVVDVPEENAKVQLVFDGVSIHNETGPAVYVKQADKCFVSLAAGSDNLLTDGADYVLEEGSDEPYATLFSKDDLTLNGDGRLEIRSSYRHAICSKDDLVIGGGEYAVTSAEDALRGRDCVKIFDGSFVIDAGDAAVKSNNDEDGARGFVVIDGGSFEVSAVGDAFHAETLLRVNDGVINVLSCEEGLEGWQVTVNGGDIHIASTDDAINAAAPDTAASAAASAFASDGTADAMEPGGGRGTMMGGGNALLDGAHESCLVEINGGYIVLDAGGDGVDSNGYVDVSGGVMLVTGPSDSANGSFDYAFEATISGGTVIMVGPSGMTQSFTNGTQAFALANAKGAQGQIVALTDDGGNVLASMSAHRAFSTVLVSAPGMVDGSTYRIVVGASLSQANEDGYSDAGVAEGGAVTQVTASTQGQGMGAGMGMGAPGGPGGFAGRAPNGTKGDIPEGGFPKGGAPERGFLEGGNPEGLGSGQMPV